jgi:hypothetical protein
MMTDLVQCSGKLLSAAPSFVAPPAAFGTALDPVWYVEQSATRHIGSETGPAVVSAVQAIGVVSATGAGTVTYATPLPIGITLDGNDLEVSPGMDYDATTAITIGGRTGIPIAWSYETSVTDVAQFPDDTTVNVYGVTATGVILLRAIHVAGKATSATIDPAAFGPLPSAYVGFVIEIVGRNSAGGEAAIASGDYTAAAYPYASASVFTYAFHVAP